MRRNHHLHTLAHFQICVFGCVVCAAPPMIPCQKTSTHRPTRNPYGPIEVPECFPGEDHSAWREDEHIKCDPWLQIYCYLEPKLPIPDTFFWSDCAPELSTWASPWLQFDLRAAIRCYLEHKLTLPRCFCNKHG